MNLLAFETSTPMQSVALSLAGRTQALVRAGTGRGGHSRDLLRTAISLLDRAGLTVADLDGLAVGLGPGTFTGVRIGIALSKGLAAPSGLPVYTATSDEIVAACFPDGVIVVWAEDARKGQVYGAVRGGGVEGLPHLPVGVWAPEDFASAACTLLEPGSSHVLVGSGFTSYRSSLQELGTSVPSTGWPESPDASGLLALVHSGRAPARNASTIEPRYIRPSEAEAGRAERSKVHDVTG